MTSRNVLRGVDVLTADDESNVVTLERLERRLGEECGELRLEISTLRGEMIDRSGELLKWLLAFFVGQTAALGALMAIFR